MRRNLKHAVVIFFYSSTLFRELSAIIGLHTLSTRSFGL